MPPGPLLARAPDFAKWQVTITEADAKAAAPPSPVSATAEKSTAKPKKTVMVVTKTGDIRHVESVDEEGQQTSKWCIGRSVFVQRSGWREPLEFNGPDRDGLYVSFAKSDFPECTWVAEKNYTGLLKVAGHDCIVFGDKVDTLSEAAKADMEESAKAHGAKLEASDSLKDGAAYIDLESRLPVAARKGAEGYVYQFLPAPTEMQTLPPPIDRIIKAQEQRQKNLTRQPAQS